MEETVLFPSPNWFQASGLQVSPDGWLIYGGPSKSLCVLEPLTADRDGILLGKYNFKTHVMNRAHPDKIVCIAICPEWPEKRDILAGSVDGSVKQWTLEQVDNSWKLKPTQSHDKHQHDKEEVTGVAYSHNSYAVTVGSYSNLVKWDIKSNVVKTFRNLKGFRPTCMSCSPHINLHVAVGTKQGVIFVVDLTGAGKTVYKVRGQDEEITNISWCPQFEVLVKKALFKPDNKEKVSVATQRMMKIRQLTDEEKLQITEGEKAENEKIEIPVENEKLEEATGVNPMIEDKANVLEDSGIVKSLPEDSFDETVVQEDDMFDIYKDHEADEFGHKKYQPEDIYVKVKEDEKPVDYLDECLKLKEEILKRKIESEQSMESLVNALDEAHLDKSENAPSTSDTQVIEDQTNDNIAKEDTDTECSVHVHKHLLASISKFGSVRIWSKSGKLVGSCLVPSTGHKTANVRTKSPAWASALWYQPDTLLIADGKSQLLQCNPLKINDINKLSWRVVHTHHKRGLFAIASNAPRVQTPEVDYSSCVVWTASQERTVVCYSLELGQKLASLATCGGFVYDVQTCPYDAGKVAVSVGDGAVRVWQYEIEDENRITSGRLGHYWQHVQGKVLCVAWHPRIENLLAFSTAESRVGLIDTSSKGENKTRTLQSSLNGGIYSLCWGEDYDLYACGGGNLVVYKANRVDDAPTPIQVSWEGQLWELSCVLWRAEGLLVGSMSGAVALLSTERAALAANIVFSKMIHTIDWHPPQTSSSSEESPLKNLIAVCSLDKQNNIAILEYVETEDGVKQLNNYKTLTGHKGVVHTVVWSPHQDGLLLSTSQDSTVRVWDVVAGTNTHIFGGHFAATLTATWSPSSPHTILSGGSDCCLRLWDLSRYPKELYVEPSPEGAKKKKKDKKVANKSEETAEQDENVAATQDSKIKASKKFLLPVLTKQMSPCSIQGVKKMLQKYIEKNNGETPANVVEDMEESYNVNYIKIFGSIKEVNEVLDEELERHEDTGCLESWLVLSMVRGRVSELVQFAAARDALCPLVVSLAPCVSLKYWKDVCQLYLAQIDRLVAKGEESKLSENRQFGGAVYRSACVRLSVHDVTGAARALADARLFKEAYVLCRTRYMDTIAEEILKLWAEDCFKTGMYNTAAVCYVALGNLSEAANTLSRSKDEAWLSLAAEMAKIVGQKTFADHITEKREQIKSSAVESVEKEIEELPSRVELLMKETNDGEQGQGDLKDSKNDGSVKDNNNEKGQGDIECGATEGEPIKDTEDIADKKDTEDKKENGVAIAEIPNGKHDEVVNKN